jgi:hypothetical protein
MENERTQRVVKQGTWLYDGTVPMPVWIIVQNWDFFYEEGFDEDPPDLNADGEVYYPVFRTGYYGYEPGSHSCMSLDDAVEVAEKIIQGGIAWDES